MSSSSQLRTGSSALAHITQSTLPVMSSTVSVAKLLPALETLTFMEVTRPAMARLRPSFAFSSSARSAISMSAERSSSALKGLSGWSET